MKYKKTITIGVIALAICLVLIALFNSTYALFSSDDYAKVPESFSTGLLQIETSSKSDSISLNNALPISDEDGVYPSEPYTFTVSNVGNLKYEFDVKLLALVSGNLFSPQYIKIQVDDGEVMTLSNLTEGVIKDNIVLNAGESVNINVRLWLSIDTPNTELGKKFNSKIVIDGKAVYTESNYSVNTFADYISNLYYRDTKKSVVNNNVTYNYGTTTGLMDDRLGGTINYDGGNIRYYGKNPNNYIYFNCDDYDNQSASTCEVWRIIGVFDNKVKIVREDSIGNYSWHFTSGGAYADTWHNSTLNKLLNGGYYNNSNGVTYYNDSDGVTTVNFASDNIGIKNSVTRELISDNSWYLGGTTKNNLYVNDMYFGIERESFSTSNSNFKWTGKIGLMYASDYGYASDLSSCNANLEKYNTTECTDTNWIYNSSINQWLITPNAASSVSNGGVGAKRINTNGHITNNYKYAVLGVRPTLYLDSNVFRVGGTGTSSDPYKISNFKNEYKGNAINYISNLYLSNKSKVVTNNNNEYQYAESVNLMNDRLGGTTSDYDAGNIRYYGTDPNNYVDIGDRDSSGNVIPYRIIGLFKDIELADGTKKDLIKVIRDESIGDYSWDNKTSGIGSSTSNNGSNDWTDSRLMMLLNPGYDKYNSSNPFKDASGDIIYGYEGSLWWNSKSGTCYTGDSNATKTCDFSSDGLSGDVHNKIESVVWNLGGHSTSDIYSNQIYVYERGTTVYSGRPTEWTGKVALMYPSDYGYATDFNSCTQTLYNYGSSSNSYSCRSNDWLFNSSYQWLLTPHSSNSNYARDVYSAGNVSNYYVYSSNVVRPVFYLDSELVIESGDGTSSKPYVLG